MRPNRFRAAALAILVGLVLAPAIGAAITFLSDDGGRHAPVCSFLDSAGLPAYCSSANPLPTASGGVQAQSDPTGFGRGWFLATGLTVPNDGTATGVMIDNANAVVLTHTIPADEIVVNYSRDGGHSYVTAFTRTGALVNTLRGMLRLTSGAYIVVGQTTASAAAAWRTDDFSVFANGAGLPGAIAEARVVAQNAGTVLVGTDAGSICRSTDDGVTYVCVNPAALGSLQALSITPVTAGRWIAIDTARQAAVSIDDGATWTATAALGGTSGFPSVKCLTTTICLAATGDRILRSTDGGQTWPTTTLGPLVAGTPFSPVALANFGSGIVNVLNAPIAATQPLAWRSTDFGFVWDTTSPVGPLNITNARTYSALSTFGGNGIAILLSEIAGSPNAQAFYTTTLGAGQVQVKGDNGTTWQMDVNGAGIMVQSTRLGAFPSNTTVPFIVSSPVNNHGANLTQTQASAANAAQTITLTGAANTRIYLYHLSAYCTPAGTATLTVQGDGAVVRHNVPVPTTPAVYQENFTSALQNGTAAFGQNMLVNVSTCGVGNTSQLNVNAFRW